MLKSEIIYKLQKKYNNLTSEDIELLFNIFIKKITDSLKSGHNIEIRGFGTISRTINKHFKVGKILHKKINNLIPSSKEDAV